MRALHDNTLRVAEVLLDGEQPGSAVRRAVSSAYYALFQRLSELCAARISQATSDSEEYRRAYRALDHNQVRKALGRESEFKAKLKAPFDKLQDARQWADYSASPHPEEAKAQSSRHFTPSEARELVGVAREAMKYIDALEPQAQQRLAVLLVVRDR